MPLSDCSYGFDCDGYPRMMTDDQIYELPAAECRVPVETIETFNDGEDAVEEILALEDRVLGFDTETRPKRKFEHVRPPAVVQFASKRKVWLFHLYAIAESLGTGDAHIDYWESIRLLVPVLYNERILKVGSGVSADVSRVLRQYMKGLRGFRDTTMMAKAVGFPRPGLRNVAACLLGLDIVKEGARVSNWEDNPLTDEQVEYAAVDAVMSRRVYFRLEHLSRLYDVEEDGCCDD